MKIFIKYLIALPLVHCSMSLQAQNQVNYDESKVPVYALPAIFSSNPGKQIESVEDWEKVRKPEIFQLFEREVYGVIPKDFDSISFEVVSEKMNPYPEFADLEEVDIWVTRNGQSHTMRVNLFLPKENTGAFPVILLINYKPTYENGVLVDEAFWPVPELIKRGFATASFHAETVAPDLAETYQNGVITKLYPEQIGQPSGMKAYGAWGWAAMRAMDYFVKHPKIKSEQSILVGHSRTGKAALWTSANDPRWSITYANESGCGGAALSRRKFGETVEAINNRFPYWFADNFKKYNGKEEMLPVDQHMLPGLIAPRAIYYSSAKGDQWADPKGEFLGLKLGSQVYSEIYKKDIQFPEKFETIQAPIHQESVGYHIRDGKHDLTWGDWEIFLEFVKKNLY
jgi:hypothetical protein